MKLDLGKPEKFSLLYSFLHNTWFRLLFFVWYKNITWTNIQRLYAKYPIIIAANHQNSLMDPLVILGIETRQITWLARADIFKNPLAGRILRFMRIMPAFRQRDGKEQLANNELVFNKCVDILAAKKVLAIFPEGTHWGYRRLRETKKAIPRIAFLTEEKFNFTLNTHILPIGINYSNYTRLRGNILINFGTPIPVKQYEDLYKKNPQEAQNKMRDDIETELQKQMIHIKHTDENYEIFDSLRYICEKITQNYYQFKGKKAKKQFDTHKKIIELLDICYTNKPHVYEEIKNATSSYTNEIKKYNFKDWLVTTKGGDTFSIVLNILILIALSPIFCIGYIFHGYLFKLFNSLAKKLAKDVQFHNSLNFCFTYLVGPFIYALYSIIFILVTNFTWWYIFPFCIGLFISGIISFEYYIAAKKTYHMIRYNFIQLTTPQITDSIEKQRRKIIKMFSTLLHEQNQ
mgnify:CR=1 FL=1